MSESPSTVFIVDDDEPVLECLKTLMESVQLRTEIYGSAQDFVRNYDRSAVGCLILDLRMLGVGGMGLYRQLREEGSDLPVIYLTGYADIPTAVSAMREGAFDFLEKPFRGQYLVHQVQTAIARHRESQERNARQQEIARRWKALSARELEVVERFVSGLTSRAIALDLDISLKTVHFHRVNIMRKLAVKTIVGLIYLVLSNESLRENRLNRTLTASYATI
jgi:two-component system response regulator TtrR